MAYSENPRGIARQDEQEGLVRDDGGYPYVALHPIYSTSTGTRKRILAFRIVVCILSLVVLVCAIVGQVVPFGEYKRLDRAGKLVKTRFTYSVWEVKEYDKKGQLGDTDNNEDAGGLQSFAVLTVIFSLVAFVLAAVHASCWHLNERARMDEEDANDKLQAKYGVERTGNQESDDSFPYGNECIENDRVDCIPFEEAEAKRRRLDRDLGISTFSLLLATAVCALITVALMATFYSKHIANKSNPKYTSGLPLFIVALLLAVAAFVLLAIPAATALYLCGAPPLPRADLMKVYSDEQDTETREMQPRQPHTQPAAHDAAIDNGCHHSSGETQCDKHQQQPAMELYSHHSPPPPPPAQTQPVMNPFYPPNTFDNNHHNVAVAQGIPVALPGPPMELLQQQQQQSEYTSGVYFEAPPQLFNVRNTTADDGKNKST